MADNALSFDGPCAVTVFHASADSQAFDAWLDRLIASARTAPGYVYATGSRRPLACTVAQPGAECGVDAVLAHAGGLPQVPALAGPGGGASLRVSVVGGVAVLACYALTSTLFATVQWLQYWDVAN